MAPEYHNTRKSKRLRAALKYAAKGIPAFPLSGKTPLTANGFYDASTMETRINGWWNGHPGANIGIPMGSPSGLVVLDRDGASPEATKIWNSLPPSLEVRTGRGAHRYYSIPKGTKVKSLKLAKDLELKGDGTYVVGAGSVHENGTVYEAVEETRAFGVAPFPFEALEALKVEKTPTATVATAVGDRPLDDGGPIPEGCRNTTLFFKALDRKDAGLGREDALREICAINEARCAPALEPEEVGSIVRSAYRYPLRGQKTPPEVIESLDPIKRAWWSSAWPGVGGKTERDIVRILLEWAERYGVMIPTGIRVSISYRDLAVAAGCAYRTIVRVVPRLKVAGWLRGDNADRRDGDSGAFVLLPRLTVTTPSKGRCSSDVGGGDTLSRLPQLTPCFRWRGLVGKGRAGVLNLLEVYGELSIEEIAERLGWSRVRDLRSRYVEPLVELGLVEDRGGLIALVGHYETRVADVKAARYGGGERKVKTQSPEGRVLAHVIYIEPKSEDEREKDDRRIYKAQGKRHRERLGLVPAVPAEEAPTEEEMQDRRESFDERRKEAIEDAIAALFAERPEYRGRRVGQITCAIAPYLEPDFPRGALGLPKNHEVGDILDGAAA